VAKVSELKERARAYEKEGEHEKALKIYLHVLSHLEGSPAIKRELPMYVKAGDLQIRLEDTAGAIASYEKAAEQYAEHGSAKSVIALAAKVLRVDPMKADFHLVHTRALIDHGHIAAARVHRHGVDREIPVCEVRVDVRPRPEGRDVDGTAGGGDHHL